VEGTDAGAGTPEGAVRQWVAMMSAVPEERGRLTARQVRCRQATEDVAARLIRALNRAGLTRIARLVTWRLTPWSTGRIEITPLRADEAADLAERLESIPFPHERVPGGATQ
jgi:hypothetical protein